MKLKQLLISFLLSISLISTASAEFDFVKIQELFKNENYLAAFKEIEPYAEEGNGLAQAILARMYKKGRGVKKDPKKAEYWYLKAAENDINNMKFFLGNLYQFHLVDYKKSAHWYEKSAKNGNDASAEALAELYRHNDTVRDYKEAKNWYEYLAWKGWAEAQYELGYMLLKGLGVDKNYKNAAYWFEESAKQDNANAQFFLGYMYSNGKGVLKDYEKAMMWVKKSANQDHIAAPLGVGQGYFLGRGVEKDIDKAKYWLRKAFDSSDDEISKQAKEFWEKHKLYEK